MSRISEPSRETKLKRETKSRLKLRNNSEPKKEFPARGNELFFALRKQGRRLTPVRQFIIDLLSAKKKPLDATTIQEKLAKSVKKVNKTTVYREIEFLLSVGIIRGVDFGEGKKRYEISDLPHHHHAICTNCEQVEDVILENELKAIEGKITKNNKFKINSHSLEFFGLCAQCVSR